MKTVEQITTALAEKYNGILKDVEGYDYIPWNEGIRKANSIFDPDGFDVEVVRTWREDVPNDKGDVSYGYAALVRVTLRTADGTSFFRDGLGFSEMIFTQEYQYKDKNTGEMKVRPSRALIDAAIKGCVSRALMRALVLLGEAFGLFLYDKEDTQASTGAAPKQTYVQSNHTGGSNGKALSESQVNHLKKNFGSLGLDVSTLDYQTGKGLLDALWGEKLPATKAMEKFNIPVVKKGDGLPIPV